MKSKESNRDLLFAEVRRLGLRISALEQQLSYGDEDQDDMREDLQTLATQLDLMMQQYHDQIELIKLSIAVIETEVRELVKRVDKLCRDG